MSNNPKAKRWAFTLNNYTDDDIQRLSGPLENVAYIIFGKEVGEQGTPHLQGTVVFTKPTYLRPAKGIIGEAHFSVCRDLKASIAYCKKEGDYTEVGVPPDQSNGGGKKRTADRISDDDLLEDFKVDVANGLTAIADIREKHSIVCARFPGFVRDYLQDNQKKTARLVEALPLRDWQQVLYQQLLKPADARKIFFIVDTTGNTGKSWFARYYCDYHGNAQIIIPGKKADMAFAVDPTKKVFFFDCPRSKQGEYILYDFLEEMKNGCIFSPKYESKMKTLDTPHIVVLMNERPDQTKLSADRYHITMLK